MNDIGRIARCLGLSFLEELHIATQDVQEVYAEASSTSRSTTNDLEEDNKNNDNQVPSDNTSTDND